MEITRNVTVLVPINASGSLAVPLTIYLVFLKKHFRKKEMEFICQIIRHDITNNIKQFLTRSITFHFVEVTKAI